jgi:molybdopterin-guanine dinucleotide biosynthesis protein A
MLDIPCVIFAGGKSSRMGEDKALLPFSSHKTLTQFQYSRLSKIFKNVYISCKNRDKFEFDAQFIEDIKTDNVYAPTAGFISLFETLDSERAFVLSVDSPFVCYDEIMKLLKADNPKYDATVAKTTFGIQPMCGIYHASLASSFKSMLKQNNHKLGYLLKTSKTNFVNFENEKPFMNLNNPDEYKEALTLI